MLLSSNKFEIEKKYAPFRHIKGCRSDPIKPPKLNNRIFEKRNFKELKGDMLKRDFEDNDVESKTSVSNVYEYNVSEKTVDIENENERKNAQRMLDLIAKARKEYD